MYCVCTAQSREALSVLRVCTALSREALTSLDSAVHTVMLP